MGEIGDYWREHREFKKHLQPGQYKCECGCHVWMSKKACSYCGVANPDPRKKRKKKPASRT